MSLAVRSVPLLPALRACTRWWLLLAMLAASGGAAALEQQFADYSKSLDRIEHKLDGHAFGRDDLKTWLAEITAGTSLVEGCAADLESRLQKLDADLETLGEPVEKEPADVVRKRKEIAKTRADTEKELAACRLLVLRSNTLIKRINAENKALLAKELLARAPSILTILGDNLAQPLVWFRQIDEFIRRQSGLAEISGKQWGLVAVVLAGALALGVRLGAALKNWARADVWLDDFSSRFSRALVTSTARYTPLLTAAMAISVLALVYTYGTSPLPFLAHAAYALLTYVLSLIVIRLLFAPPSPAGLFLPMTPDIATGLSRRLSVLALIALFGYLMLASLIRESLPESAIMLARSVLGFLIVANIIWALWLLKRSPRLAELRPLIIGVILALAASVLAEWIGYRNLAFVTRRIVIGTALAFGATLLLSRITRDLFDAIDEGTYAWTRRLRGLLGTTAEGRVTGIMWLRLVTTITIWSLFALLIMYSWGISDTVISQIRNYIVQGFDVGSLRVIPVKLFWAAVSFAILLTIGGWLRSRLEHRWLVHTPMDRGAREALVTMSGYLAVMVAALVSLGIAGLDFSRIAIIAGALSVGIGFGLQNIVNNFISGLILLFERPVKTGDWIVVGNTEGYVKRIRIRSTQIQTFDRADVIVPNSELISNQVTNWMLRDTRGRARIAVGVAYGSDTALVKKLLEEVAEAHPRVIKDGSSPGPRVLFRAFGDSALEFELRVHIYNVDERLRVISDLNFAIDAAFREHGIEIPFPQRDLHVRDWPDRGADSD